MLFGVYTDGGYSKVQVFCMCRWIVRCCGIKCGIVSTIHKKLYSGDLIIEPFGMGWGGRGRRGFRLWCAMWSFFLFSFRERILGYGMIL